MLTFQEPFGKKMPFHSFKTFLLSFISSFHPSFPSSPLNVSYGIPGVRHISFQVILKRELSLMMRELNSTLLHKFLALYFSPLLFLPFLHSFQLSFISLLRKPPSVHIDCTVGICSLVPMKNVNARLLSTCCATVILLGLMKESQTTVDYSWNAKHVNFDRVIIEGDWV